MNGIELPRKALRSPADIGPQGLQQPLPLWPPTCGHARREADPHVQHHRLVYPHLLPCRALHLHATTEPPQSQPYTGAFDMEMGLKSQTWRLNVSFSKFIFPRVLSSDITRLLYTSLSTFYSMLWSPDCSTMPTAPLCPRSDTWLLWSHSLTWCSTRLESAFEHYMS